MPAHSAIKKLPVHMYTSSNIGPAEYWSNIQCPRCHGDLTWFGDGADSITVNDNHYWKMCTDVDVAFCKKCCIQLPYCPLCTYLPPRDPFNYDFTDFTELIRQHHPSVPPPQPGDFQFLTFLGCEGETGNNDPDKAFLRKPNNEGPYSVANIGMEIPYCIDNPLPGCDESSVPGDIIIVGPDGGSPTYWWCTKCKIAQDYTDK